MNTISEFQGATRFLKVFLGAVRRPGGYEAFKKISDEEI